MSVSMYDALSKFTQSLLADNVVITFPGYTKSYHPNENIEHCQRTSKMKSKWKIPLNIIPQRLFATMIKGYFHCKIIFCQKVAFDV